MKKINVSWDQFYEDCKVLAYNIKKSLSGEYDSILAISRGGVIVAGVLSYLLNIKNIYTINISSYNEDNIQNKIILKNINVPVNFNFNTCLIIDDIFDSGNTFKKISKILRDDYDYNLEICGTLYSRFFHTNVISSKILNDTNVWIEFPWDM